MPGAPRPGLGSRFWALWAANTTSGIGDGLNAIALPLLATTLTRRPLLIAAVAFAQRAPWLVVGLPAGAYADRVDRAQLMRRVDVLRGALLAAVTVLVLTREIAIATIYVFALAMGVCEPFFAAANQAMLPSILPTDLLSRGNALLEIGNATTEQTAGPAIGGVAFSLARAVPFALDALSFLGSTLCLLGLSPAPGHPPSDISENATRGLWRDIREGLAWYRSSRPLVVVTATVAVLAFAQAMVSAIMVLFALERLHLGSFGYGFFMAAVALGNVLGGLIAARVLRRTHTDTVLLAAMIVSSAAYLGTSATTSPLPAASLLALEATAVVVGSVATVSYRQAITPPTLQARVAAVWRTAIWGAIPLGALTGGAVAASAGLPATLIAAGAAQLAAAAIAARPLHRLFKPGTA